MTGDDEIMTGDPHWNDFPRVPLLNFFRRGGHQRGTQPGCTGHIFLWVPILIHIDLSPRQSERQRERQRKRDREREG